jgi:hypothetical protein
MLDQLSASRIDVRIGRVPTRYSKEPLNGLVPKAKKNCPLAHGMTHLRAGFQHEPTSDLAP